MAWHRGRVRTWSEHRVRPVVELLAGRWVLGTLEALDEGELRRVELHRRLGGVSDKVLTETLRRLELAGWVSRTFTPGVPAKVDYALTETARSLWPLLSEVQAWAEAQSPSDPPQ